MDSVRSDITEKLKSANSILVTVSRNPSVDQLSSLIGLTLVLNKLGKHTAAVFSGQVPSTIEFLKPGETIEKTTDSLRDFIISLDRAKADKLRYKVEDNVVRIFLTPYKTSITQDDLSFSQGDFNVDAVVALGVLKQEDLDAAITAHGRILHDASVITINTLPGGELGSINWTDQQASSLGELVTELTVMLGPDLIDGQIATALLTGIVAETNRFSNQKTNSQTMNVSATLMAAGANQQLVATQLEITSNTSAVPVPSAPEPPVTLVDTSQTAGTVKLNQPYPQPAQPSVIPKPPANPTLLDQLPDLKLPSLEDAEVALTAPELSIGSRMMTDTPLMGGTLTANIQPEGTGPTIDPLTQELDTSNDRILSHNPAQRILTTPSAAPVMTPPPANWSAPVPMQEAVPSSQTDAVAHLDSARDLVTQALGSSASTPAPIQALNAQPLGDILHSSDQTANQLATIPEPEANDPNTPPPVPPPIPFQFRNPPQ
jgi:hypothetical protein